MISLNQLRTFLEVSRTGSVREAADRLVVSQPAVSSALASLARSVGTALVERDGRGLRLTAAGERLAAYGRRVFALLDEAVVEANAAASASARAVRLAAVTTAAEQLVPLLLAGGNDAQGTVDAAGPRSIERPPGPGYVTVPGANGRSGRGAPVELFVANRDAVWDRLAHEEADLALGGRPPDERFVSLAVRPNALVVVGRAGTAGGFPADGGLGAVTWLVREEGSGTRATTEALFEALGIAPRIVTIGSNGAIVGCVRAGLGVSLLSRDAVARDLADETVTEIPTRMTPLDRAWHLAAPASRALSPAAQRFLDHVVAAGTFRRP